MVLRTVCEIMRIERGGEYNHEMYGSVQVRNLQQRIDAVRADGSVERTVTVEFTINDGGTSVGNAVLEHNIKKESVEEFRASCD